MDITWLVELGKSADLRHPVLVESWEGIQSRDLQPNVATFCRFHFFPLSKSLNTDQGNYQRNQMEHRWSLALNLWLHWLHWLLHLDGLSHGMDVRLPLLRLLRLLRLAILHRGSVVVGMHGAEKSKVKVIFTSPYGSRRITLPNEWGWTCINLSYVQGWV